MAFYYSGLSSRGEDRIGIMCRVASRLVVFFLVETWLIVDYLHYVRFAVDDFLQ